MGSRFTSLSLFLHILIMMCAFENGVRVMATRHWQEETSHEHEAENMKDPRDKLLLGYLKDEHRQLHPINDDGNEVMKAEQQPNIHDDAIHDMHDDVHKDINVLQLHSMDGDAEDDHLHIHTKHDEHAHVKTPHVGHMDPSVSVFLIEKDLKIGNMMPIYFPNRDPSASPHFLPREKADSIPFSSAKLPYLLQLFSYSNDSPQAKAMGNTLRQCELAPIERETKLCATSLESMLDFTRAVFGMGTHYKVLTTIHHRKSTPTSQNHPILHNYSILNISRENSAHKMVACHTMPYPYAVFYCHHQRSKSKVFKVSLIGEYDEEVEAVVVCHMDTSSWDPSHVSFLMLGIKPGTDPVCHFFPDDHLVWVPSSPSF